jgi:hypothetical protein
MAPGDYRLLAFDELEAGAAEDVEFMRRFEGRSKAVTIRERGMEVVDVGVIAAEASGVSQ